MISFSELAAKLGVTRPTITGWVRQGLPWHGNERRKQFEPQEVRDWLLHAGIASTQPVEAAIDNQPIARNRHEVANHFGVSMRTVADWLTDPSFPGRSGKPGRRDGFFPLTDIAAWWNAKRGNTPGANHTARGPQDRLARRPSSEWRPACEIAQPIARVWRRAASTATGRCPTGIHCEEWLCS